jgi:hypothetical protein
MNNPIQNEPCIWDTSLTVEAQHFLTLQPVSYSGIRPGGFAAPGERLGQGNVKKFFLGALPQTSLRGAVAYLGGAFGRLPRSRRRKNFSLRFVWAGGKNEEKMCNGSALASI